MTPGIEVDCPSWNLLVHLDIDYNAYQDWNRNLVANKRYLILIMLQWVMPFNEIKKGRCLGKGIL